MLTGKKEKRVDETVFRCYNIPCCETRGCWNRQTGTFEVRVSNDVGVQVPSPAPQLDTSFDTMRIEAGVQFLFVKSLIYKAFSILFNERSAKVCKFQRGVCIF